MVGIEDEKPEQLEDALAGIEEKKPEQLEEASVVIVEEKPEQLEKVLFKEKKEDTETRKEKDLFVSQKGGETEPSVSADGRYTLCFHL